MLAFISYKNYRNNNFNNKIDFFLIIFSKKKILLLKNTQFCALYRYNYIALSIINNILFHICISLIVIYFIILKSFKLKKKTQIAIQNCKDIFFNSDIH